MKFAIKYKNNALNRTDLLAVSVYGYTLDIDRQKDSIITTNRPPCLHLTSNHLVNWP